MTMTDTEAKALALVNAVCLVRGEVTYDRLSRTGRNAAGNEALCRTIERLEATEARHAAELRELKERFSEAARSALAEASKFNTCADGRAAIIGPILAPFILPAPDPLVEAVGDALEAQGMGRPVHTTTEIADHLRAAMLARAYEWRKIGEAGE